MKSAITRNTDSAAAVTAQSSHFGQILESAKTLDIVAVVAGHMLVLRLGLPMVKTIMRFAAALIHAATTERFVVAVVIGAVVVVVVVAVVVDVAPA